MGLIWWLPGDSGMASPVAQTINNPPAMQETWVGKIPSILAWRIPWSEEPGGLQSMGSHRVGHD